MKKIFKKVKLQYVFVILFSLLCLVLLAGFTKGDIDSKKSLLFQEGYDTKIEGPFELSNTTSRYALTQSLVENKSVFLNINQAQFSAPDVVYYAGKYFTIFTPGVSFLGVPFYIVGKYFGAPQIGSFSLMTLAAFINIFLVTRVARKMGANIYASLLGGFVFAFATNALGYTQTFTQHQLSTMVILLGLLNSLEKRNVINNVLFGSLFGVAALFDIPNVFLLSPMLLFILSKHFEFKKIKDNVKVSVKLVGTGLLVGLIPLIVFFAWYNHTTASSYTKLAQNIGRVTNFSASQPPKDKAEIKKVEKKEVGGALINTPFQTRSQLNGFYILMFSNERSWIYYSPILLLGMLGLWAAYKKTASRIVAILIIGVVSVNVVLYSMFGDPWGGWAFGPRYLIPAASLMAASVGVAVSHFKKNYLFAFAFLSLFTFSTYISILGAITTNSIPPKVEAINFKPPIHYTPKFNYQFVTRNNSSNLFFNVFLKGKISLSTYLFALISITSSLGILLYVLSSLKKEDKK